MFSDIKKGFQVHLLYTDDLPVYKVGRVVAAGEPRFLPPTDPASSYGRVLDLSVECDGETKTYTVPEMQNVAKTQGMTLSVTIEPILNELESLKKASEEIIGSLDFHKERAARCSSILEEANPAYRQTREQDRKIRGIEDKVTALSTSFEDLKKLIVERLK